MSFHLAGIIPVAGQKLDFDMPWHDCLTPIGKNYLAIERSVVECAYAGCETIWIVCHPDMQPLIKHRLGDYVQDPVWINRHYEKYPSEHRKTIPIFYVSIHPNDRDRRDCLSWSALYGCYVSNKISSGMSKWLAPERFYITFPYGITSESYISTYRKNFSSKKFTAFEYEGKSIFTGDYVPFTVDYATVLRLIKIIKEEGTGLYLNNDWYEKPKRSLEDRYSARFFSLKDVFKNLQKEDYTFIELKDFSSVSSWEEYCAFIGANGQKYNRPSEFILKYRLLNPVALEEID